jgi:hypothetical protein
MFIGTGISLSRSAAAAGVPVNALALRAGGSLQLRAGGYLLLRHG